MLKAHQAYRRFLVLDIFLAFCSDDGQLLCINCILFEGHKGHSFQSLEQSVQQELQKFMAQNETAQQNQAKILKLIQQMSQYQEQLETDASKQTKDIQKFFNQLKMIVNEREQKLYESIAQTVNSQKQAIAMVNHRSQQLLQDVNEYLVLSDQATQQTTDQIGFLSQSTVRNKLLQKINIQIPKLDLQTKLPDLNKENETNIIIKTLLNSKASQKQQVQTQIKSTPQVTKKTQEKICTQSSKDQYKKMQQSRKIPLAEMVPNAVQINLKKKMDEKQPVRLTNFQEARNQLKERNYEKSLERRRDHSTPRRLFKNVSKNFQQDQSSPFNHKSANELYEIQQEDSMKQEFQTFLNSVHDFEQSDYNIQLEYSIMTIGGFVDNLKQIVEKYDIKQDQAIEKDAIKSSRCKFGVAHLLSSNLLIMGGKQDGQRLDTCEEYNYKEKKLIQSKIKLPQTRSGFGVLNVNQYIYIVGGNDGSDNLNSFDIYNQIEGSWIKGPNMTEQRDELAISMYDNVIFAIGGFGGQFNTCLKTVEIFQQNKWSLTAPLNVPRRALASVSLPDGIYVIGGFDGGQYLNSVEKYDDGRWILIQPMLHPRCTLSAIATPDNQFIYVFGGFDNAPLDSVEKFDVLSGKWEETNPLVSKRFMHQSFLCVL
ncbi:hypothetical protein pb186bvf_008581 [Paramecium bursaria]